MRTARYNGSLTTRHLQGGIISDGDLGITGWFMHKKTCKWYDVCPLKSFYEQGRLDKKWIEDYCMRDYLKCLRYKMEEERLSHADNMMPDGTIDRKLKERLS